VDNDKIEEQKISLKLDGKEVSVDVLEEAKQKSNTRIIEDKKAGPGNFKTLYRLTETV
jgi:hypothetical protein